MFESQIRKTLSLNKKDLSHIKGTRLYFNKIQNIIWLILLLALLAISIYVIFIYDDIFLRLVFSVQMIFLFFLIRSILAKIALKNPIAIITSDGLYYLFTDEIFEIHNFELEGELDRKALMMTLKIRDLKKQILYTHAHWNLKNLSNFESKVNYYKTLLK